jgi:hypothetical protein
MVFVPAATWPMTTDGRGAGDAGHVVVLGQPEALVAPALGVLGQVRVLRSATLASLPRQIGARSRIETGTMGKRTSVDIQVAPHHDVPRVETQHLTQYLLGRHARVVVDDQEARLRGLGELGELRGRRVVFGRELLECVGPPASQAGDCPSWISTSHPLHASIVAGAGLVSPEITIVRSGVSNR